MTGGPLGGRAWLCVLGSGTCCGLYYYCLGRAYGESDFTIVYPLARALPVVLVALWDVLIGRMPTLLGWAGMLLVVAGGLVVPLRSLRGFRPGIYLRRAGLWVVLTALGTVGYTVLDKLAAETVRQGPVTAARYGYLFFAVSWVAYGLLRRLLPYGPRRGRLNSVPAARWQVRALAGLAGAMNFGAYWLVLWAYQLVRQTAYLVAFRQLSIVLGVAAAFVLYKERRAAVRLTGTALIVLGLVLIALWGR